MQRPSLVTFLSVLAGIAVGATVVGTLNVVAGAGFDMATPYWAGSVFVTPIWLVAGQALLAAATAAFAIPPSEIRWWLLAPLSATIWLVVLSIVTSAALDHLSPLPATIVALAWSATAFPFALAYVYKNLVIGSPPNKSLERTRDL
jgi:hypothetical protein